MQNAWTEDPHSRDAGSHRLCLYCQRLYDLCLGKVNTLNKETKCTKYPGQPILGLHEIGETSIRIKNVTMEIISTDSPHLYNKSIEKKLQELRIFQEIGILPQDLSLMSQYIKCSFNDKSGNHHHNYFFGISSSDNDFQHYIKTTGKGCGMSVNLAHEHQEVFRQIELISGICLYGNKKFQLRTQTGRSISLTEQSVAIKEPISDISVDDSLSLYEIEAIMRLSSFVNMLVQQNGDINTIHVEIPKGQYHLLLAEAYQNNYLSPEIYQQSLAEIDKRHNRVFQAYKRRLHIQNIHRITPLSCLENYFHNSAHKKQPICIKEAQGILSQNRLWQRILSLHPAIQWKELGYLSHVFVFLSIGRKEPHKAVLQIDDPIEEKIHIRASDVINRLGEKPNYRVWGIYPLQKVVLDPDSHPDSGLYYCPEIKLDMSTTKKVLAQYRIGNSKIGMAMGK